MKYNIASCGKTTNRLYFESKEESKMNQSENTKIRIRGIVDNYYVYNNRYKNLN